MTKNKLKLNNNVPVSDNREELSIENTHLVTLKWNSTVERSHKQEPFMGKTFKGTRKDGQTNGVLPYSVTDSNVFLVGIYRKISDVNSSLERPCEHKNNQIQQKQDRCSRKWIVLTAAFWITFLCVGFPFNITVLNLSFLEEFKRSTAETSLIQSVLVGIFFIAGLPVGVAVGKHGVRKVGICGSLLAAFGLVLSFFATGVPYLVVTMGLITAVGLSACYISASTSVGEYFEGNSKLRALSFISFGSGCADITFPYFLDFLTGEFGWRGCLLVVGGMIINMVPCFALCKPRTVGVSGPKQSVNDKKDKLPVSIISDTKDYSKKEDDIFAKFKTLLTNEMYVLNNLALLNCLPALTAVSLFFINFLQVKGFNQQTSLYLFSCMRFVSTIFRLAPGLLKTIPHVSILMIPALFTSVGTVVCALIPHAVTYEQYMLLLGVFGMSIGGVVGIMSVSTMKLAGVNNYSLGIGIAITGVGIGNVCGGPISGYIKDTTGSYTISFYIASASLGLATCLYILAAVIRKHKAINSTRPAECLESRRVTRRRSSVLPWKGKVEFIF